jgi:hypothetical protein
MDAYPEILNDLNEWSRFIGEVKILFRDLLVLTPDMVKYMVIKVPSITDDNPYVEFPLWRFTFNQKSKVFLNKRILAKWREIGEKAGEINF